MNLFFRSILLFINIMIMLRLAMIAHDEFTTAIQEYREGKICDYAMKLKRKIFECQKLNVMFLLVVNVYFTLRLLIDTTVLT